MRTKLLPSILITLLLCLAADAQVKITAKKITYKRPRPQQDFKKTFTITRPVIRASTPAVSRKIESALSYQRVFKFSIKDELGSIQWLEDASYDVGYNADNILSVGLTIEGTGAYPSSSTEYVVVDTRTGAVQTPTMVFTDLGVLAAIVRRDQKKEVDKSIVEIRKDPDFRDPDPSTLFDGTNFTIANLKRFSIDEQGVVFHYEYGFPHAIQAIQPTGEFFYSWTNIKKYIKRGGLLGPLAR
jgi:hypothetical protein